jgi:hypothetical protein
MAAQTRERIVNRSAELFRRQGFAGTGVKQIVAEASAPFGSLYHFFTPGGDPVAATRNFFAAAAATVRESDYADACPIATVALEVSSTSEPMRQACADVFNGWVDGATERLVGCGLSRKRSRALAFSMIASLEGAFVLSRALRSTEPIEVAGATVTAEVREAMAKQRQRQRS